MQSKNEEHDEELVNKVNRLINDPQAAILEQSGAGSGHSRMAGIEDFGDGTPSDVMQQLLGSGAQGERKKIVLPWISWVNVLMHTHTHRPRVP